MKNLIQLLVLIFFISCSQSKSKSLYYSAISLNKRDTAYLEITIDTNDFYGKYNIHHFNKKITKGTISGERIGDTLKGKYRFIDKYGIKQVKPIIFLKENQLLKLGIGKIATYMEIPYYMGNSIEFNDSLFQFKLDKNTKIMFEK